LLLTLEKSKPVYHGLATSKKPKSKRDDDEPMGRPYKKTKEERGVKFIKKERSGKSGKGKGKKTKTAVIGKRKGKPKARK
jgi:hypothetical protein